MPEKRFHRGDVVQFRFGTRLVQGTVKEDRGPIGIKGRRLYLIEFRLQAMSSALSEIELPAERLQAVHEPVSKN